MKEFETVVKFKNNAAYFLFEVEASAGKELENEKWFRELEHENWWMNIKNK